MILALGKKQFRDEKHGEEMLKKYGDCVLPPEEAEWFGLSIVEALRKSKVETAKRDVKIPLKYELSRKLIEELNSKHLCYVF